MESLVFIGIDVSKATLDIAVGQDEVLKIDNTASAIRRWMRTLPSQCAIGVESTGNFHLTVVKVALAYGQRVYVLNPRDLAHYARALGRRAKTDRLDAQLIARYLTHEHEQLHPYELPTALQTQLHELIGRRHGLVVAREALRASFNSASHKLRTHTRLLRAFQAMVEEVDLLIQKLIREDPALNDAAKRLYTLDGFGPLLSASFAHLILRHPYRNTDAFVASLGLDPKVRDSGQLRGRRYLSKRGPGEPRRLLFNAAMAAAKTKLWRPFYQYYRNRGFSSTAALIIIARKLARVAFSIVRYGTKFQPERLRTPCVQP